MPALLPPARARLHQPPQPGHQSRLCRALARGRRIIPEAGAHAALQSGPMSDIDDQGRTAPPVDGDELSILRGFLDFHRATFAWKTDGLDAAALNSTVG